MTILIDGNSLGYAHQHGNKLSVGGMETQAIYGVIRSLRYIRQRHPGERMIVLWDGNPKWRKDLYPEYKSKRNKTPEQLRVRASYKKQTPFIRDAIKAMGIDQWLSPDNEADDLAGAIVTLSGKMRERLESNGRRLGGRILLVSGDMDWIQLVDERVSWWDPIRERSVENDTLMDFTGFNTGQQFLEAKALQGDNSDNIKGVGGIGEVNAAKLINKFGSVDNLVNLHKEGKVSGLPKRWKQLAENEDSRLDKFRLNMELMSLRGTKRGLHRGVVQPGIIDWPKFTEICEDFMMNSILAELAIYQHLFGYGES